MYGIAGLDNASSRRRVQSSTPPFGHRLGSVTVLEIKHSAPSSAKRWYAWLNNVSGFALAYNVNFCPFCNDEHERLDFPKR
jgi:hypothetical protein